MTIGFGLQGHHQEEIHVFRLQSRLFGTNVWKKLGIIILEEKAEVQDQYPLSLNPVQKADDPIQDRNRNIILANGAVLFWPILPAEVVHEPTLKS